MAESNQTSAAHAVPTMIKKNPAAGVAPVKLPKSKGHHTWFDDQIAKYRAFWKLGTQQRLVSNSHSKR